MQIYIVLTLIFAVFVTMFAIFNASLVTVSLFFVDMEVSLALVIIVSALIGAIVIILFDTFRKIRSGKHVKDLQKKVVELEQQIALKDEALKQRDVIISQKDSLIKDQKETLEVSHSNKTNEMVDQ